MSERAAQYLLQLAERGEREPPQHLSVMSDAAINSFMKKAQRREREESAGKVSNAVRVRRCIRKKKHVLCELCVKRKDVH